MKKILVLHSSSDLYGASKIIYIVSVLMKQNGIHPIVCLSEHGPLCDKLEESNIEFKIIPLCEIRRKYFNFLGILNRILTLASSLYFLNKYIRTNQVETIYSNTTAIFTGALYAWIFKKDHIWHVHEIINDPPFLRKVLRSLMKNSKSKVIAVSDAVRNNWSDHSIATQIQVIQNGIDPTEYLYNVSDFRKELGISQDDDVVVIGMIARLNAWKGHHYFLQIAKELIKIQDSKFRKVRFIIVGDVFPGEEYRYKLLEQEINNLKLAPVITCFGFRKDVANILNGLDLLVLPSIKPDPFPTIILESFFSSTVVAATNHGGATEMIKNNENGILIPWDDAPAAASFINMLISNKAELKVKGQFAKVNALNLYTLDLFEKRLSEVIENIH